MYSNYFEMIAHNYNKMSILIPNNFLSNVGISNSTIPPLFFFLNLRLHVISGVINKIISK